MGCKGGTIAGGRQGRLLIRIDGNLEEAAFRIQFEALVPHGAPVQFRWRRLVRRVARIEGPERLAPEWWRGPARTRD